MLIILSPTKTIDIQAKSAISNFTLPEHTGKSKILVDKLKEKTVRELAELMNISPKLALLNFERFQQWSTNFTRKNSLQAIFAYKGEVFHGLDAQTLTAPDISYAQKHLVILSGLYGTLKPLDMIQPYRLEMGLRWELPGFKNLYDFWKETITNSIKKAIVKQGDNVLVNLASNEYFKSINVKNLNAEIITPEFKEYKNGSYKTVTIYTKKARGLMTRFIITNRIGNPGNLKLFDYDGYYYNDRLTENENNPVFTRN